MIQTSKLLAAFKITSISRKARLPPKRRDFCLKQSFQMSDSDILHLIECSKSMSAPIPSPKIKNRNYDQRFTVYSEEHGEFKVFVSQSVPNPSDFSVGLVFDDYLLFRCNGLHGPTKSGFHQYSHHVSVHTHTLTEDDIYNGRDRKPTKIEDVTGEYADVRSALRYFCVKCGIINFTEFAPEIAQTSLFEGGNSES